MKHIRSVLCSLTSVLKINAYVPKKATAKTKKSDMILRFGEGLPSKPEALCPTSHCWKDVCLVGPTPLEQPINAANLADSQRVWLRIESQPIHPAQ